MYYSIVHFRESYSAFPNFKKQSVQIPDFSRVAQVDIRCDQSSNNGFFLLVTVSSDWWLGKQQRWWRVRVRTVYKLAKRLQENGGAPRAEHHHAWATGIEVYRQSLYDMFLVSDESFCCLTPVCLSDRLSACLPHLQTEETTIKTQQQAEKTRWLYYYNNAVNSSWRNNIASTIIII